MSHQMTRRPLRFLHIGDLHITEAGLQNAADLRRIVDEISANAAANLDFIYLPGDIADDGTPDQFKLVHDEISRLPRPWRAIPGDHDFKPRALDSFYGVLGCRRLPFAEDIAGCACLFLDVVSAGTGGPDFRVGPGQLAWLKRKLDEAKGQGRPAALFMHTYPSDLGDEAAEVAALIDQSSAVLVEMGHTHYNELANDGRTIYAATRSTGQIEEGEVGFAFVAIDNGVVSWRFKPLASPWPFVAITSPADHRLAIKSDLPGHGACDQVRASAWGASPIARAEFRIDGGAWHPMADAGDGLFSAPLSPPAGAFVLSVRVSDRAGGEDTDSIRVAPDAPGDRLSTGSDAGSIGAWPERHLLGTQLGPNRNGRKW